MKATFLKYIMILLIFLFSSAIFAQQRQKTEANADLTEYTNKEGLPSTSMSNIVQTKDGYIWLSGIEGTYRFNGYEFEEVGSEYGLPKMQNMYYDSTKNILYFASPQKFITFDGSEFKTYTDKEGYRINGISGQVITFINADSKGRIWVGSATPYVDKKFNGGLTEFDKGKFVVYDSTNFPLDNATGFLETPYGDLIFNSSGNNTQTYEGSYIALFKNGVFKKIDESAGISLQGANIYQNSLVTAVDKDGNTWIAFYGVRRTSDSKEHSGVLMYDGNKFHEYTDFVKTLDKDKFPFEVFYSKQLDKLFLTTMSVSSEIFTNKNKSVYEFGNGAWKPSDVLQKINSITDLKTGKEINDFSYTGCIFVNGNKYFPESLILLTGNLSTTVAQSSKYPNQFFSYSNGKWAKYDAFSGVGLSEIINGYLLSTSKGFSIYYPNYSKMLTKKDGVLQIQGGIPILYTDKNGIVWISYSYSEIPAYAQTFNTGINIWDGKKLRGLTEKDGLAGNITFNTFQDSKMRVWIPTSKGITAVREIVNSDGEQIFKLKNIQSDKKKIYNATNVIETKTGDVYSWQNFVRPESKDFVKADFYLGKYEGEKFVEINSPFNEEDNKNEYQLFDLKEDNQGKLWFFGIFSNNLKNISTNKSRIKLYDGKSWSDPPKNWNVPDAQLHYVGRLKNGMYFLTVGGFYVFNGNKFVNLSDSVDANADFRILKGASVAGTKTDIQAGDRLYIRLRGRGLVIFDGTHLKFYTKKEGLPSTVISNPLTDEKGNVFFAFPSGALMVTGDKFRTYYYDENIVTTGPYTAIMDGSGNLVEYYNGVGIYINKGESESYPLKISSVSVSDKNYYYTLPADYSYSQNSFVFNYAAFNFKDPDQTTYEHFLDGYDKDWSRPTNLAFAEYQNLPSGKYIFRVRGVTSNGVKTNEAAYTFVVNPPLWRTWWAYLGYVVVFGFVLVGIRKYELDQRKERETKKFLEIENERKTKELEEAKQLQLSMLPKSLPNLPHLDIAVYMKTATEVGGDYYDFHVHPDGTLTVILGDATGHGMMSGMMVSIMKSLFMSDQNQQRIETLL